MDEMPKEFWLIAYGGLVWNREMLAFVSSKELDMQNSTDMAKFWFLEEKECTAQLIELRSLGIEAKGPRFVQE
jgi:hypothetical protein